VLVVAAVFDAILQMLGRLLMPWNRRDRRVGNPMLLRNRPIGGVA
jgi:hypothetical protein